MSRRDLPTNVKAEQLVLGAMIRSADEYWRVANRLQAHHFSVPLHGQIYSAIGDLCREGRRATITMLCNRLPGEDESGSPMEAMLAVLFANSEDVGSAVDFVDDILDTWAQRQALGMAEWLGKAVKKGEKPIADILSELEAKAADIGASADEGQVVTLRDLVDEALAMSAKAHESADQSPGFDTGLTKLDEILKPMKRGRLYFLGGEQKAGKTMLAQQILQRASLRTFTLMCQGEMRAVDIGTRAIAGAASVSTSTIEDGAYQFAEWEAINDARKHLPEEKFLFWRMSRAKVSQIRHKAIAEKRRRGDLGMIVVDHLLLVRPEREYDNEFRGIGEVVEGLKEIAEELNTVVICMTHRTRSSQDRSDPTPQATDFYGGGAIERGCDALFCVWNKHRWLKGRKPQHPGTDAFDAWVKATEAAKGKVQVSLLAHRHASFPHTIELLWHGSTATFEDVS